MDSSELGGRRLHHWRGLDRIADIAALADTMAAAIPDLANRDGRISQLVESELRPINLAALHGLADKHIAARRLVNHGAGWQWEYYSYKFPPAARHDASLSGPQPAADTSQPDEKVLDEIYRVELLKRLPRVE